MKVTIISCYRVSILNENNYSGGIYRKFTDK